jgi:Cu(I)/Ag(I) efflux system membrane fusion protein
MKIGLALVLGVALVAAQPGSQPGLADEAPAKVGGGDKSPGDVPEPQVPIRLDPVQRQAIGLTYGTAEWRAMDRVIRTVGRFDYDERKLAQVTLKVSGYIQELFVDYTGQPVRKGDPLFSIYSPDLVSAQQEYLLARQTEARLRDTQVPGALESARALVDASRERLRLWDLSEAQVRDLAKSGKSQLNMTIHSPISGVVIEKTALRGQRVEPGMTLYKLADLSTIWVYGDIYEYELPAVKLGQEADISLSYEPGKTYQARVAYVSPTLDEKTRTVRVRFELENPAGEPLKPGMYGKVELHAAMGERLVVPEGAVLDSGRRQVVFVARESGELVPQEVKLGDRFEGSVEVRDGLAGGERIVTSGNFLVDSESKLQGAESMMGMMGAIGMGDWKMESARPMTMGDQGGGAQPIAEPSPGSNRAAASGQDKQVGDLLVSVSAGSEPPKAGQAAVRVRVRRTDGEPVKGASVRFQYTMDMPGMSIEQSTAHEVGDGIYEGTAQFTMGGPWGVVVEIAEPGKPAVRGKFTLRVAG